MYILHRGRSRSIRQKAVYAELACSAILRSEACQVDLSVRDGRRGHLCVVVAIVAGSILKGVPQFVVNVVCSVGMKYAGARLVPRISAGHDGGPEDALLSAV